MGGMLDALGMQNNFHAEGYKADDDKLTYGENNTAQQRLQGYASGAQERRGPRVDYGNANNDRGLSYQSRNSQNDALSMMRQAAQGLTPSVAQQQLQTGVEQGLAAQVAAANSARGTGMAGAQRTAAYMGGNMQAAANAQSAQLRAAEMAQAREAYAQTAMQQRMQDLQSMGMSYDAAFKQAQVELQQRELNDRYQLGLEGLSAQIGQADLQARAAGQGINLQGALGSQGINAQVAQGNAAATGQLVGGIAGAVGGVATGGMSMGAAAAARAAANQGGGGGGGYP